MKKYFWWILAGVAVLLFFIFKNKIPINKGPVTAQTTNTQTTKDPFWVGWGTAADTILQNTTAAVRGDANARNRIANGVFGLFGGASSATGRQSNPATNGSGAAPPLGSGKTPGTIIDLSGGGLNDMSTYIGETDSNPYNISMNATDVPANPNTDDPNSSYWGN